MTPQPREIRYLTPNCIFPVGHDVKCWPLTVKINKKED
jgi:hypothetical protein